MVICMKSSHCCFVQQSSFVATLSSPTRADAVSSLLTGGEEARAEEDRLSGEPSSLETLGLPRYLWGGWHLSGKPGLCEVPPGPAVPSTGPGLPPSVLTLVLPQELCTQGYTQISGTSASTWSWGHDKAQAGPQNTVYFLPAPLLGLLGPAQTERPTPFTKVTWTLTAEGPDNWYQTVYGGN